MMFTNIGVRNFKSWLDAAWEPGVGLAPVTAIFGRNSSGKSSLLQPLLLLRQTILSPDPKTVLNYGERGGREVWVDVGGPGEIQSRSPHFLDRRLEFRLRFLSGAMDSSGSEIATFKVSFLCENSSLTVESIAYEAGEDAYGLRLREHGEGGAGAYELVVRENRLVAAARPPAVGYEFAPERATEFPPSALRQFGDSRPRVEQLVSALRSRLEALNYLRPTRATPPRRVSLHRAMPSLMEPHAENMAEIVLSSPRPGGDSGGVFEGVNRWLPRLGLGTIPRSLVVGASDTNELRVVRGDAKGDNLLDVGFGVSQVLPVLALGFLAPKGSTVIIEEPETHLHPTAQATLAEYFVEVAKERSVQFLIETHSEHLFRRFQTLVAKKSASPDDFAFYFVSHTGTHSALERLTIDPFGRVKNWPENFFGDVFGETAIQVREMIERQGRGE